MSFEILNGMTVKAFHYYQEQLMQGITPSGELTVASDLKCTIRLTYERAIEIIIAHLKESCCQPEDLEMTKEDAKNKRLPLISGALLDKGKGKIVLLHRDRENTNLYTEIYSIFSDRWVRSPKKLEPENDGRWDRIYTDLPTRKYIIFLSIKNKNKFELFSVKKSHDKSSFMLYGNTLSWVESLNKRSPEDRLQSMNKYHEYKFTLTCFIQPSELNQTSFRIRSANSFIESSNANQSISQDHQQGFV